MLHRAEVVGDPMLTPVANQEDVDVAELAVAVRATKLAGVDVGRLGDLARLPMGAADHPRHDVLEAAEHRAPVARGLVGAEPVAGLHRHPAPAAALPVQPAPRME
jgi:hypothetical protein